MPRQQGLEGRTSRTTFAAVAADARATLPVAIASVERTAVADVEPALVVAVQDPPYFGWDSAVGISRLLRVGKVDPVGSSATSRPKSSASCACVGRDREECQESNTD